MIKFGAGPIEEVRGLTVKNAVKDTDEAGYPFMRITFTDNSELIVEETGQTGWIDVTFAE